MSYNIPLNQPPFYNTDTVANSIASDDMFDCYLESVPNIGFVTRRRPGLVEFCDLNTGQPGDGLYYWDRLGIVIAVSCGRVFKVEQDGTITPLTGTSAPQAGVQTRFASGQALDSTPWLYMAGGGLTYTTNGTTIVKPSDVSTPTATHVAWINGRFIANVPDTDQFWFTDTNPSSGNMENDYWSSTNNPITAEAKGDYLRALFTSWQEIYAWCREGLQVFQDDGATPFTNVPGAYSEAGLEATYSVACADNTVFALCTIDNKRVVVRLQGRAPQVVSEPIARILAELPAVSDAIGDIVSVGGIACYMLTFPSANQTWVYDYKNNIWLRWGHFNPSTGVHDRFIGQHACYARGWNKHLIMSSVDGRIYEMSRSAYTDGDDRMVTYRRTGWIDHGNTWKRKQSGQLFIKVKSFPNDQVTTPKLLLRWRDDGNPVFSQFMEITLNPDFQGDFLVKLNRMGMYRSRQWEFRVSDNVDLVLVGATEDVQQMRS